MGGPPLSGWKVASTSSSMSTSATTRRTHNLRSYFFSNEGPEPFGRVALEYVWEVGEDTFTIWGGEVGSPACFKGKFSDDRNTIYGRWKWPGGGYETTMTRVN